MLNFRPLHPWSLSTVPRQLFTGCEDVIHPPIQLWLTADCPCRFPHYASCFGPFPGGRFFFLTLLFFPTSAFLQAPSRFCTAGGSTVGTKTQNKNKSNKKAKGGSICHSGGDAILSLVCVSCFFRGGFYLSSPSLFYLTCLLLFSCFFFFSFGPASSSLREDILLL